MLQSCQFELDEFIDLPTPSARGSDFRLSLTKGDRLTLSSAFHAHLDNASDFRLRISPDGYTLLLDTVGPFNLSHRKGSADHPPAGGPAAGAADHLPRLLPGPVV